MKERKIDLEKIKLKALRAISPIRPADSETKASPNFLFNAKRSNAGKKLPEYYLVYFLLVDLLGFRDLGKFEKISWSVPIDYKGKAYLIEHRKFGIGVFVNDADSDEIDAENIVRRIIKGVKIAEPYFEYIASEAVASSKVNINNNCQYLYERYEYFLNEYKNIITEAEKIINDKKKNDIHRSPDWVYFPGLEIRNKTRWLAMATIDAFYSWSEHVFIHIAAIRGNLKSGVEVANIVGVEWQDKFKVALDISVPETKKYYDELIDVRRQLRNFIAHGAFGKEGEAFSFHSGAGAAPVFLPHKVQKQRYKVSGGLGFDDASVLKIIEEFIEHIWSGNVAPAKLYVQDGGFPLIMTYVTDGTYDKAMSSMAEMEEFVKYLSYQVDQASNMDW